MLLTVPAQQQQQGYSRGTSSNSQQPGHCRPTGKKCKSAEEIPSLSSPLCWHTPNKVLSKLAEELDHFDKYISLVKRISFLAKYLSITRHYAKLPIVGSKL